MAEDQLAALLSAHTLGGEMKGSSGSFRGGGEGQIAFLQFNHSLQSPLFLREVMVGSLGR